MDRNAATRLLLLFLCVGSALSVEQTTVGAGNSSHEFSDQDSLQRNDHHHEGDMEPKLNVSQVAIAQVVSYNLSRAGPSWRPFSHSHHSPLNVTVNGIPCILFWAKRIMIRLENHTQLDLTEKTFGVHATVDLGDSNCSEDSAMLSLKFGDIGNLKGLVIRTEATSKTYWYFPYLDAASCSLAGLLPSTTHIDQIQGFNIQEGHFAYAKDCASFLSPAILMGLVMSLILLLVLAYALHMLIHLKSLDRHYECKASPAYFAQMKDNDMGDEKEPLRNSGIESYELRNQQFGKIYI
ncbi:ATPase H+ transporting accessory protein 1 like protein [Willisornis vidua]|uniref:ATPase H+ transporting accessory protein 1 like protein n=1 Tax=Willisornis vidua TaxID=1566151 RepID=A0ABQ9DNX6_9PASS|nr:ATPase H+ transporting accessory protein 1 like protein [Willisornis vidua]